MRVAVIGAGAVGGALALLLDRAGHSVVLTTRVAGCPRRTLHLRGAYGVHDAEFEQRTSLEGGFDLVIVAVKAQHTLTAIAAHLQSIALSPTLVVQNGLDGAAVVEHAAAENALAATTVVVAGGLATFAVNRPSSDTIQVTAAGAIAIGSHTGTASQLRELAETLSQVIDVDCVDDLRSALWSKLLINQVNALPAITGLSVQELGRDSDALAILGASMRELIAVAHADGATITELGPLTAELARSAETLPLEQHTSQIQAERIAGELSAAFGPTPNYASTLQSIRRGEATEIDALNGAVVQYAFRHGLEAPVNSRLTALVHDAEASGPQLTARTVRQELITSTVNSWFERSQRPLPWRDASVSPWGVLVSETMLQQTQAARVEPKWREFMERWPTPKALAAASEAEVLRFWDRLGYPRRALWLLACAKAIARTHDGSVPRDRDALLTLPGVGPYTASAVLSFAYAVPEPVVDTNVRRVLARAFEGVETPWRPSAVRDDAAMRAVAPSDTAAANRWNAAAMELGAVVCTSKRPDCDACPIAPWCAWYRAGRPASAVQLRRQAKFAGSDREMRGMVLRELRAIPGGAELAFLRTHLAPADDDALRFERAIATLKDDRLIVSRGDDSVALAGD